MATPHLPESLGLDDEAPHIRDASLVQERPGHQRETSGGVGSSAADSQFASLLLAFTDVVVLDVSMGTIVVKNVPEDLHERLKERAERNGQPDAEPKTIGAIGA